MNCVVVLFLNCQHKKQVGLERGAQRRNPLIRSMSDRRDKDSNEANFNDTTALRTKLKRSTILRKPIGTQFHRPKSPPPKLPDVSHNQTAPQRPPRQQST